jgi:hypothetical protein
VQKQLRAVNRELLRRELAGVERLHNGRRWFLDHEPDVQLRGVGARERVRLHDLRELCGGAQHNAWLDAELLGDRSLEGLRRHRLLRREDHVAALDERAHVGVAERLDERTQVGHRHLVLAADVDAAEQSHIARHQPS